MEDTNDFRFEISAVAFDVQTDSRTKAFMEAYTKAAMISKVDPGFNAATKELASRKEALEGLVGLRLIALLNSPRRIKAVSDSDFNAIIAGVVKQFEGLAEDKLDERAFKVAQGVGVIQNAIEGDITTGYLKALKNVAELKPGDPGREEATTKLENARIAFEAAVDSAVYHKSKDKNFPTLTPREIDILKERVVAQRKGQAEREVGKKDGDVLVKENELEAAAIYNAASKDESAKAFMDAVKKAQNSPGDENAAAELAAKRKSFEAIISKAIAASATEEKGSFSAKVDALVDLAEDIRRKKLKERVIEQYEEKASGKEGKQQGMQLPPAIDSQVRVAAQGFIAPDDQKALSKGEPPQPVRKGGLQL